MIYYKNILFRDLMKTKRIVLISLFFFLILFLIPHNNQELKEIIVENTEIKNDHKNPETSALYIEITTQYIDPLSTDTTKHWSWYANNKGWCSGTGSSSNPFIIDNLEIDVSSGSCLIINNTNGIYFEVRNSKFIDAQSGGTNAGIVIINTNNGKIINCNVSKNAWYGMYFINCLYISRLLSVL